MLTSHTVSGARAAALAFVPLLSGIAGGAAAQALPALPDSVVRGDLLYKAHAELSWSGQGKLGSPRVMGDVNATVTVKNIGRSSAHGAVKGCRVRLRAYLVPSRSGTADFVQFGERHSCTAPVVNFSLDPGSSRVFKTSAPAWDIAGGQKSLGPWYFVVEVHLPDTVLRLRGGQVTFDPGLTHVRYVVRTGLEGIAPASLVTRITAYNRGSDTVHMEYGSSCVMTLLAHRTPEKHDGVVWRSDRRAPPRKYANRIAPFYACTSALVSRAVPPGDSVSFIESVPTYEILADSLPARRYYFTALLGLNWRAIDLDAGYADLSPVQERLPSSRTIHGIQYSAKLHRARGGSLQLNLTVKNLTDSARHLKPPTQSDSVRISGYSVRADRESWYMGSQEDWLSRPAPIAFPDFVLQAKEARTFHGITPAPFKRLHYMVSFWIDDAPKQRVRSPFIALSADEK